MKKIKHLWQIKNAIADILINAGASAERAIKKAKLGETKAGFEKFLEGYETGQDEAEGYESD